MIKIPIEEFVLEVPTVNTLTVHPIASPRKDVDMNIIVQDVYYTLLRSDGRVVEQGNKAIPLDIYLLVQKYIDNTVDETTIGVLNAFFTAADWAVIKPIIPVIPEEPTE